MTVRHDNSTQLIKPVGFKPLLKNESPYFNNLNRGPKNAYDYADNINKILSYGGYVSRVKPLNSAKVYNIYNIVKLLDGETISDASSDLGHDRFAIVVTEKDAEGYYIVCTFCPNFVYPANIILFTFPTDVGKNITVDYTNYGTTPHCLTLSGVSGDSIVAKVTGATSIFFCGTTRLFGMIPEGS